MPLSGICRPSGLVSLDLIVSRTEKETFFSPKNEPSTNKLIWLEGKSLLAATRVSPSSEPIILEAVGRQQLTDLMNSNLYILLFALWLDPEKSK